MTFVTGIPNIANVIGTDLSDIETNFDHIKDAISQEHGWDDSDATQTTHNRAIGVGYRSLISDGVQTINLSFTPTLVGFVFFTSDGNNQDFGIGFGFFDGSVDGGFYLAQTAATSFDRYTLGVPLIGYDGPSDFSSAICAFISNGFTLTWSKHGSPNGTCNYMYFAFG